MSKRKLPPLVLAFDRAIEIIEKGWCQGGAFECKGTRVDEFSEYDSACLFGSLEKAARSKSECDLMANAVSDTLLYTYNNFSPIVTWNDNPARTKRDVIELLKDAKARVLEEV